MKKPGDELIEKYNAHHDAKGRFSTKNNATFISTKIKRAGGGETYHDVGSKFREAYDEKRKNNIKEMEQDIKNAKKQEKLKKEQETKKFKSESTNKINAIFQDHNLKLLDNGDVLQNGEKHPFHTIKFRNKKMVLISSMFGSHEIDKRPVTSEYIDKFVSYFKKTK